MNMDHNTTFGELGILTKNVIVVIIVVLLVLACGRQMTVIEAQYRQTTPSKIITAEPKPSVNEDSNTAFQTGLSLLRSGHFARARDSFQSAVASDFRNWKAHYYLGLALGQLDNSEQALVALHNGLKLAPKDDRARSRIYVALAEVHEDTGQVGKAKLNFTMALNLWPESIDARSGLQRLDASPD